MENPTAIASSAKLVELQIMQGKLESSEIESLIQEQTFQGPGKLHKLFVAAENVHQARAILEDPA